MKGLIILFLIFVGVSVNGQELKFSLFQTNLKDSGASIADIALKESLFLKKKLKLSDIQTEDVYKINRKYRQSLNAHLNELKDKENTRKALDIQFENWQKQQEYIKYKELKMVLNQKQWEIYELKKEAIKTRFNLDYSAQ